MLADKISAAIKHCRKCVSYYEGKPSFPEQYVPHAIQYWQSELIFWERVQRFMETGTDPAMVVPFGRMRDG